MPVCAYCQSCLHDALSLCEKGKADIESYKKAIMYIFKLLRTGDIILLDAERVPRTGYACKEIVLEWIQRDILKRSVVFHALILHHFPDNIWSEMWNTTDNVLLPVHEIYIQTHLAFFEDLEQDIIVSNQIRMLPDLSGMQYRTALPGVGVTYRPVRMPFGEEIIPNPIVRIVDTPIVHTEDICSICLTAAPSMKTQCGHSFCTCIVRHLSQNGSCPLCRTVITHLELKRCAPI